MNTDEIKAILARGEMKQAAEALVSLCKGTSFEKEAISFSGRIAKSDNDWQFGTLSREHYQLEINAVAQGMLGLLDRMAEKEHLVVSAKPVAKRYTFKRFWAPGLVAAVLLALIGLWWLFNLKQGHISLPGVEGEKIHKEIRNELIRLNANGEYIKDVSINPNYSWVILYGMNSYSWHDVPEALRFAMDSFARNDSEIKQVILGPHNEWLFLLNYNGYWQNQMPQDLTGKLDNLFTGQQEIKQVALGTAYEWLVLHDYNGYTSRNIPKGAYDAIVELNRANKEIRGAAWGGDPVSWIVLGAEDAYFSENIDPELKKEVLRVLEQKQNIRKILILHDEGWLILQDGK